MDITVESGLSLSAAQFLTEIDLILGKLSGPLHSFLQDWVHISRVMMDKPRDGWKLAKFSTLSELFFPRLEIGQDIVNDSRRLVTF